jgi:hypothetical protein
VVTCIKWIIVSQRPALLPACGLNKYIQGWALAVGLAMVPSSCAEGKEGCVQLVQSPVHDHSLGSKVDRAQARAGCCQPHGQYSSWVEMNISQQLCQWWSAGCVATATAAWSVTLLLCVRNRGIS